MIRATSISNTEGIDNLIAELNGPIVEEIGAQVFSEVELDLAAELTQEPPPIRPGVFKQYATPKQLRYVMAKIRRGEWTGRTGATSAGWSVSYTVNGGNFTLVVMNDEPQARFVYGSLALSSGANPLRFQQKFHQVTGWPQVSPIVNYYFDVAQQRFAELVAERLGGATNNKRFGTTPRQSRKTKY